MTAVLSRKVWAVVVAIATASLASCGDDGSSDAAVPNVDGSSTSIVSNHGGAHHVAGDSSEADPDQLQLVRSAMAKYEDIEVALADGWVQEHPDWPETGAHFYRESDWAGPGPVRPDLDPVDPEFLMYSKLRTGEWELVAVAYVVDQALYPEPPTELQGAAYHEHVWTCIVDGEELEEDDYGPISREECTAMDGEWSPGGVWMTHVWFIENPDGPFAEENPALV